MKDLKRLPDAELEVMQAIWSLEPPVTAAEVQQQVSRDWKATSVLTFLAAPVRQGVPCLRKGGASELLHAAHRAGSLPAAGEHQLYQAAVRRLGQEPGRQPVGRGRADRAGHRRPARFSGRAGTVGWEG